MLLGFETNSKIEKSKFIVSEINKNIAVLKPLVFCDVPFSLVLHNRKRSAKKKDTISEKSTLQNINHSLIFLFFFPFDRQFH